MTNNNDLTKKVRNLFKKYGIKSITMDDVSREMGMSKKTLYQIVSDKNELVEMAINSEFRYYTEKLHEITLKKSPAVLSLIKINGVLNEFLSDISQTATYDLQKYHIDYYEKIKRNYGTLFLSTIKENIIKGKEEGVYRKKLNEDIVSKLHLSRIEEFKAPEFVKEICLYHIYGIINTKGKKHLEKYIEEIDILLKPEVV